MKSMNRTPLSIPSIPATHNHLMWQAWDLAVEQTLLQLKNYHKRMKSIKRHGATHNTNNNDNNSNSSEKNNNSSNTNNNNASTKKNCKDQNNSKSKNNKNNNKKGSGNNNNKCKQFNWKPLSFFLNQLKAFELWLENYPSKKCPLQLPIVLQVMLNQEHRVEALRLLIKYLDQGSYAVHYVLSVDIFPYFRKLLKSKNGSPKLELLEYLSFIWAKILSHDPDCCNDLIMGRHYLFFFKELGNHFNNPDNDSTSKTLYLSTFILAQIANFPMNGQTALLSKQCKGAEGLLTILQKQLKHYDYRVRMWSILCISKLWHNKDSVKKNAIEMDINDDLLWQEFVQY